MTHTWLSLAVVVATYYAVSVVDASAVLLFPRGDAVTTTLDTTTSRSRRFSPFPGGMPSSFHRTSMVARKETKEIVTKQKGSTNEPKALQEQPVDVSFDDLGPAGKVVAATTELAVAVIWNYCQGYLTGLFFGTLIGIPGFAFRPVEKGLRQPFIMEVKGRFARMNTRSVSFGKNFAGVSAIFKGSDTAVRRLRYGKNDGWNDVLGSAIAGAIFARQGMFLQGTTTTTMIVQSKLTFSALYRGTPWYGKGSALMGWHDLSREWKQYGEHTVD
jgi:Tim17/Tim22/Tim23/Pmp24 family